jgi:hypothetical protein
MGALAGLGGHSAARQAISMMRSNSSPNIGAHVFHALGRKRPLPCVLCTSEGYPIFFFNFGHDGNPSTRSLASLSTS